jgi:hypothetical protein
MKIYKIDDKFMMEDQDQIIELTPNKDYYLKLPKNSCNRVWVSCRKVDESEGQCIDYGDTVKIARTLGPRNSKKLEEYMTEEEKRIIEEIMNRCKERKELDKPQPKTDVEKAKEKYEKYKREYEKLLKTMNEEV